MLKRYGYLRREGRSDLLLRSGVQVTIALCWGWLSWLTSFSPVLPEAGNPFATVVAMTSVSSRFMRSMWMSLLRPRSENVLPLRWPTCMASSTCMSPPLRAGRLLTCTSSTWTTARLSMSARNISPAPNLAAHHHRCFVHPTFLRLPMSSANAQPLHPRELLQERLAWRAVTVWLSCLWPSRARSLVAG